MKGIFLCSLLSFMFHYCGAQEIEIKYTEWLTNFTALCTITCNDSTCILQFNIVEKYVPRLLLRIDRSKESNKILCSDNELISIEQISKVKDLYQKATCLVSYPEHSIVSNDYVHIIGVFYNDTLNNKFEMYHPTTTKDAQAYDFYKLSVEIIQETVKNKKSKKYIKYIGKYL